MRTYPWGEATATCSYAVLYGGNYGCGTNAPWAVGSISAGDSPYGLHDMAGNVWEWTRDWYGPYTADAQTDPLGAANSSNRTTRGGSFADDAVSLRASARGGGGMSAADALIGLRCMKAYTVGPP